LFDDQNVDTNRLILEKLHAVNAQNASSVAIKIAEIVCMAIVAHFLVRLLQFIGNWMIRKSAAKKSPVGFVTHQPKFVTLTGLITSALTLVLYSIGLGFILNVLGMNTRQFMATYLATASVVGFAVGFGSQGLVQDVITGLTLIFTNTLEVGDMVEISGQVGRVESVGLRFTELRNFNNQQVFLTNRNIANIARFPRGGLHVYVDVQIPANADRGKTAGIVTQVTKGMWEQFKAVILHEPEISEIHAAKPDLREFVRVDFKVWPGQGSLIETVFRQRIIAALKQFDPNYADWMVPVTYRAIDLMGKNVSI
jgi:moderate conductance mechanosensitive channel